MAKMRSNFRAGRNYCERICPECGGTGRDMLDGGQCSRCNGLGIICFDEYSGEEY